MLTTHKNKKLFYLRKLVKGPRKVSSSYDSYSRFYVVTLPPILISFFLDLLFFFFLKLQRESSSTMRGRLCHSAPLKISHCVA